MGRFTDFIKGAWDKVKSGARKVGGFLGKVLRPIIPIAKTISGSLAMTPGKVGAIAKIVNFGTNILDRILPGQETNDTGQTREDIMNKHKDVVQRTHQNYMNKNTPALTYDAPARGGRIVEPDDNPIAKVDLHNFGALGKKLALGMQMPGFNPRVAVLR